VFLEVVAVRALDALYCDNGAVVSDSRINNLKVADDITLAAESQKDQQTLVDRVVSESLLFILILSTVNT